MSSLSSATARRVAKELKDLTQRPLEGIAVAPTHSDLLSELDATLAGPQDTPFEGGRFTVRLKLGADFPSAPPKAFFVTKIFHPNVAPATGEICVNTLKRDWQESFGVAHVLLSIKGLLMLPNAESALNEEAGRLLLEAYDDYFARARTWTTIHARAPEDKAENRAHAEADAEVREDEKGAEAEADPRERDDKALGELNANSDVKLHSSPTKPVIVAASKAKPSAAAPKRGAKRL